MGDIQPDSRRISLLTMTLSFVGAATLYALVLPTDVLTNNAWLAKLVEAVERGLPGITTYASQSPHPGVVALVLSTLWLLLPALIWTNATKVHAFESWTPPYVNRRPRAILMLAILLMSLAVIVWLIGFIDTSHFARGQGRARAYGAGIAESRIVLGVLSSLTFLAIAWLFLALLRAIRLTFGSKQKD